ncbi:MAG: hypothetical protein Q8M24_14540 [Pseudolabrys sp.]|nr:hypothetical protein [Pseudolabrys sp.]MDP2296666.1 hypothetical protein [Pseudolabrys sp.]
MSPELYFAVTLIVRMAVTAAFLLAATVTAERAGPLIGGLVATLPISAGPIYIFLAIDHGAHFIGVSALGSLVSNGVNIVFALTYALLAQKRSLAISLSGAFVLWIGLTWLIGFVTWTLAAAILFNLVVLALALWLSASLRHVRAPQVIARWHDLVMRAAMVALLVGVVVTLSYHIGPTVSGNLAVFPIVLTSIIIILHRRAGGPATAAVMANAIIGLGGFGVACIFLNLTADWLGAALALVLTLAVSFGCNLLVFAARNRLAQT